jgi:hypothetical protein
MISLIRNILRLDYIFKEVIMTVKCCIITIFLVTLNSFSQSLIDYNTDFKDDSLQAELYKTNKVKSVTDSIYYFKNGKLKNGGIWQVNEYNPEGFVTKITFPGSARYILTMQPGYEIDSITFQYDKQSGKIIEKMHVKEYPQTTIYQFDSLGRIISIEELKEGKTIWSHKYNYYLHINLITQIYPSQDSSYNGYIYKFENNRIRYIYSFNRNDTNLSEKYIYEKNRVIHIKYDFSDVEISTTQHFDENGIVLKEISENSNTIVVKENLKGYNYKKHSMYERNRKTNFALFEKVSNNITYFKKNGLPDYSLNHISKVPDFLRKFIYEYYEYTQ